MIEIIAKLYWPKLDAHKFPREFLKIPMDIGITVTFQILEFDLLKI